MNAKTQTDEVQSTPLDTLKLLVAAAAIIGGMFAYYYPAFAEIALALRVLMVMAGTAIGVALFFSTTRGGLLWKFIQGSRIEIRKVVWPTKQETTQTTIAVFVFTLIMGVFFWALDSLLLWVTRTLTA
ncbi:MAG: preprotein translocase subunit SecE [Pseudomonadota bacterium]